MTPLLLRDTDASSTSLDVVGHIQRTVHTNKWEEGAHNRELQTDKGVARMTEFSSNLSAIPSFFQVLHTFGCEKDVER